MPVLRNLKKHIKGEDMKRIQLVAVMIVWGILAFYPAMSFAENLQKIWETAKSGADAELKQVGAKLSALVKFKPDLGKQLAAYKKARDKEKKAHAKIKPPRKMIKNKDFQAFAQKERSYENVEMMEALAKKKKLDPKYMAFLWEEINRLAPNITKQDLWKSCASLKFDHKDCDPKAMYETLEKEIVTNLIDTYMRFVVSPEGKKYSEPLRKACLETIQIYRNEIKEKLTKEEMAEARELLSSALETIAKKIAK